MTLDLTNAAQIRASRDAIESLDVLINNAGVARYDDLSDPAVLEAASRRQPLRPYA